MFKLDFRDSNDLIKKHETDKLPFRDENGRVFCAFSMEQNMPPCPFDHRGPEVEVVINGVITQVFTCCDARMHANNFKPLK